MKKLTALLLALVMCVSLIQLPAFAADCPCGQPDCDCVGDCTCEEDCICPACVPVVPETRTEDKDDTQEDSQEDSNEILEGAASSGALAAEDAEEDSDDEGLFASLFGGAEQELTGQELRATAVDGVITLDSDVKLTTALAIPKDQVYTLDLNGKTITTDEYAINNAGSLTITGNGSIQAGSYCVYGWSTASLTIENGSYTAVNSVYANGGKVKVDGGMLQGGNNAIYAVDAEITINDGTLSGSGYNGIYAENSVVEINGGKITGTTYNGVNLAGGSLTVSGGTLQGNNNAVWAANAKILVGGGTFTGNHYHGIYAETSDITISDGSFTGFIRGLYDYESTLDISGGTFDFTTPSRVDGNAFASVEVFCDTPKQVTISGGHFKCGPVKRAIHNESEPGSLSARCAGDTLAISGGTFDGYCLLSGAPNTSPKVKISGNPVFNSLVDIATEKAEINGGTFYSGRFEQEPNYINSSANCLLVRADLTITGGTFVRQDEYAPTIRITSTGNVYDVESCVSIKGGTFKEELVNEDQKTDGFVVDLDQEVPRLLISQGTFSESLSGARYLAEGATVKKIDESTYIVGGDSDPTAPDMTSKFRIDVSSKLNDGNVTTVTGKVDEDYKAELILPKAEVNAGNVTIKATMNNVGSLGVKGHREHSITLNTGLTAQGNLPEVLSTLFGNGELDALYGFQDGTINATIKTFDGKSYPVTYTLKGSNFSLENSDAKLITGTPDSPEAARAAWQAMVNGNIITSTQEVDNSYVTVANGSWLQIDTEKLVFEKAGDLTVDPSGGNTSVGGIKEQVKLVNANDSKLAFCLKKGTQLAVGSSVAALNHDVTVTVSGVSNIPSGVLSGLRDQVEENPKIIILALLAYMEAAVKMVDDAGSLDVTIDFTDPTAPDMTSKFRVDVSSALKDGGVTTVTGKVDKDYKAELVLPNAEVNAGNVTIKATMNNVGSLEVNGHREHSITLNTGLTAQGNLPQVLSGLFGNGGLDALYGFRDGTINATVKTVDGKSYPVTYTLAGTEFNLDNSEAKLITGTPNSAENARAAWQAMVNGNISTSTQAGDNSFATVKYGSWLQIGTEKLVFEKAGDLTVDPSGGNTSVDSIKAQVKLENVENEQLAFCLKKGTQLAVGSSVAALDHDVTVTVSGVSNIPSGVLSGLRDEVQKDPKAIIVALLVYMEAAVKMVDTADAVTVTIDFTCQHSYMTKTEAVAATCTEPGIIEYWTCVDCDKLFKDAEGAEEITEDNIVVPALQHKWGSWKNVDDKQHSRTCENDPTHVESEDHQWDEGTITTPPSVTSEGKMTYTCTVEGCGATRTETLDKSECTHEGTTETRNAKPATCEEDGYTGDTYCTLCEQTIATGTVITKLGHAWGDWTKTDDNQHSRICKNNQEHTESADHIWVEGEVTKKPTETETGTRIDTCKDCGAEKTVTLPVSTHTHSYSTDWKTNENSHWHECSCGDKSGTADHTFGSWRVRTAATTSRTGTEYRTCTVCDYEQTRTISRLPSGGGSTSSGTTSRPSTGGGGGRPGSDSVRPGVTIGENDTPLAETPFRFIDVPEGSYCYDAVYWAVDKGITNGVTENTFVPNGACTRAQIVTFLWRAAGSPEAEGENPFTDVAADAYYYNAVLWAVAQGITGGTTATTFSPNATCTRGQAVTFLYRAAGSPEVSGTTAFTDVTEGAYYTNAVLWAVEKGVTGGTSATTFAPNATCTRGQIVTFLHRDRA